MIKLKQIQFYNSLVFIVLISLIISCTKEENDLQLQNFINVKYSSDTIPEIDITSEDLIGVIGKSMYLYDSVYNINLNFQHNVWDFSIWIPKDNYQGKGQYELGDKNVNNWMELVQYVGNGPDKFGIGLTSHWYDGEQSQFILYDETDTSFRLKLNSVKLFNSIHGLSAVISCDIEIEKFDSVW